MLWVPTVVLSGGARGADFMGEKWAQEKGIPVERYPADWEKYGLGAGPRRNVQMAKRADALVAFLGKAGKGTMDMIINANRVGLRIVVHYLKEKGNTMSLNLKRPIVFFDLETTGLDVAKDRIVDVAIARVPPDRKVKRASWLVNPQMPIPEAATGVHGITDANAKDKPTFAVLADEIAGFFKGADISGFNIKKFDLPLLMNEFLRVGTPFDIKGAAIIDTCEIFHAREPRDLQAAFRFYQGDDATIEGDAHRAATDTEMALHVFAGQLKKYAGSIANTVDEIARDYSDPDAIDLAGKLRRNGDHIILTFGQHKGEMLSEVPTSYLHWMIQNSVIGPDAAWVVSEVLKKG